MAAWHLKSTYTFVKGNLADKALINFFLTITALMWYSILEFLLIYITVLPILMPTWKVIL